jgi:hypothetical protein
LSGLICELINFIKSEKQQHNVVSGDFDTGYYVNGIQYINIKKRITSPFLINIPKRGDTTSEILKRHD